MIESAYTRNIHKRLPANIHRWKINDNFAGGVPDAFYRDKQTANGTVLWVEYKLLQALPKRAKTLVVPNLTAQQKTWLNQAVKAGELAWVIIGCKNMKYKNQIVGVVLTDPDEWDKGIPTDEFVRRASECNYSKIAELIQNAIR